MGDTRKSISLFYNEKKCIYVIMILPKTIMNENTLINVFFLLILIMINSNAFSKLKIIYFRTLIFTIHSNNTFKMHYLNSLKCIILLNIKNLPEDPV